jgi:magnesium-transporting ATPase (P-type)
VAESEVRFISGSQLALLDPEQVVQATAQHTVFSQVSPQQTEQVVRVLRHSGKAVGVIGESVSDVAAMRQADLALTRRSSSPAALSAADIILLDDSPLVLSRVMHKGQRIVNGLLDVLKLYLTQIFYMLLLIVGIPLVAFGFPYSSAQGSLIALFTLTIPAVGLSLWSEGGQLPKAELGRVLSQFIWPAAVTMGLAGLLVYALFLQRSDSTEYAQLAVTYALVAMGLLLVVFVKPPLRFAWGRLPVATDMRPTILVLVAAGLFVVMTYIPLAQRIFDIAPLRQPDHYLAIGLAVMAWALGVRFLWLVLPLERRVRSGALSRLGRNTVQGGDYAGRPAA